MTEAEILAMRIGLTGLIISVVSVAFGMISAYIAGLWLFLSRAPFSLGRSRSRSCRWGFCSWAS